MFFLASAAVIWVFVQFSKQYTVTVNLPVEYINIPQDKILDGNNPSTLEMRLRDNGFRIARYNLFPPTLEIDVTAAVEQNNALFFDLEQQKPALLSQLGVEFEDAYFLQPSLSFDFEQKAIKTVKVVSNIVPEFAVGYSALEEIELTPDSVRISGPASVLDTLEEIGTAALRINNISNDISGKVKIETGNLNKVVLFNDEVTYTLRTAKFTEGKVEIPIELINVPDSTNVVIFPKEVMVFYQVSLKDFDKVKPSSFRVIVDFNKSAITNGYLLAELAQKPVMVNNVRLSEKKIQFVIKR